MIRKLLLVLLICPALALSQQAAQTTGAGAPTNPCGVSGQDYVDTTNHVVYHCGTSGTNWVNTGSGSTPGALPVLPLGSTWIADSPFAIPFWMGITNCSGLANAVQVKKITYPVTAVVKNVSINVTTLSGGNTATIGLYDSNGNKLFDSGTLSTTTTGFKTAAVSWSIAPGVYYLAWSANNATPTLGCTSTTSLNTYLNATTTAFGQCANAASSGVLPSTCGSITNNANNFPVIVFEN